MEVTCFAEKYRLRSRHDECGDLTIPGKHGHLYAADGNRFGICLLDNPSGQPSKGKVLLSRRRKALAAGFVPHQIAEYESIFLFDPANAQQASLAIQLVGAKQRRVLSPETRAVLAARMKKIHAERTGNEKPL